MITYSHFNKVELVVKVILLAFSLVLCWAANANNTSNSIDPMSIKKMDSIITNNNLVDLDKVPSLLPEGFRLNFILKHGAEIIGPRGHLFEIPEAGKGQGATAKSPRAILFDQDSGFSISYNGGGKICQSKKEVNSNGKKIEIDAESDLPQSGNCQTTASQKNGHTLDMMEFDAKDGFKLWKWDLNGAKGRSKNNNGCVHCHGPDNRPIYSMYPDWPGFYGSDNDEITNPDMHIRGAQYNFSVLVDTEYQKREFNDYRRFRKSAKTHPRYAPLFEKKRIKTQLNYDLTEAHQSIEPASRSRGRVWAFPAKRIEDEIDWRKRKPGYVTTYPWNYLFELFPFRPAHTLTSTRDISRAFKFRPGLRFNILMSRYHTKNLSRIIRSPKNQKNYKKFGKFFVYNLMRCTPQKSNRSRIDQWIADAGQALQELKQSGIPAYKKIVDFNTGTGIIEGYPLVSDGGTGFQRKKVPNSQKTRLLEYERSWLLFGLQLKDVDMRYSYNKPEYEYVKNPTTGPMKLGYFGKNGVYFNAYNDGSTTTDELIVANLLQDLIKQDKDLNTRIAKNTRSINWKYTESVLRKDGSVKTINEAGREIRRGRQISKSFFDNGGTKDISDDHLNFWGLAQKYGRFPARYTLDRTFFKKMDKLGMWLNLPYDPEIAGDHHRAPWGIKRTQHFTEIYDAVCDSLEGSLTVN